MVMNEDVGKEWVVCESRASLAMMGETVIPLYELRALDSGKFKHYPPIHTGQGKVP